jgi:hypothetical protein
LHHLLAQCRVFLNLALNAITIGLQFSPQCLKLTDEIVDFAYRFDTWPSESLRFPADFSPSLPLASIISRLNGPTGSELGSNGLEVVMDFFPILHCTNRHV